MLLTSSSTSVHNAVFQTSDSSLVYTIESLLSSGWKHTTISKSDANTTAIVKKTKPCASVKFHSLRDTAVYVHGRNVKPERVSKNVSLKYVHLLLLEYWNATLISLATFSSIRTFVASDAKRYTWSAHANEACVSAMHLILSELDS